MKPINPLRFLSTQNRKKEDPGKYVFTGESHADEIDIQFFKYNKQECVENKDVEFDKIDVFEGVSYKYWLNINGLNDTQTIASICHKQGIHGLAIQDVLDVSQRPKFQEFENFSFLTLKSIIPFENEFLTEQISFVFGTNFLMSFQERKAGYFEHIRTRLREDKGFLRERGSDYLLYTMLESILDNYFKALNKVDEEISEFNFVNLKTEPSPLALQTIENHKRFVNFIKKATLPIKEFTQILERGHSKHIEEENLKYFIEIKDLCASLIDNSDMILSSLESEINLFFSVQGHRMNKIMGTLTIVSTIFIPLTFIAGIYGMNFVNMPELEWEYGYFAIWLLIILIFLVMLFYFKRKRWF